MALWWNLGDPELEDYERSALVLSILACPSNGVAEGDRRLDLHDWLCGRALGLMIQRDPDWGNHPQRVKPRYLFSAAEQTGKTTGPITKLLQHRMVAAKMAMPFLIEASTGAPRELPRGIKRRSLNAMADFCLDDAGQTDASNLKSRIWRPSRPVIHLACAFAVELDDRQRLGLPTFNVDDLLLDWPLTEGIVQLAQTYEALVERSNLRISPDELVCLRIACSWGHFKTSELTLTEPTESADLEVSKRRPSNEGEAA